MSAGGGGARAKGATRRTQAQRRAETRTAVLESACRHFGSKGYADASLEAIAGDCGLTIAPIYHYFGNKRALFEAVVAQMNDRILESLQSSSESAMHPERSAWHAFLDLCGDPGFRKIVLIDAPAVLGRERWAESPVYRAAGDLLSQGESAISDISRLERRMLLGALTEAALTIAESKSPKRLAAESEERVTKLLTAFRDQTRRFDSH
jgi:AcrR family transcriptional regulator